MVEQRFDDLSEDEIRPDVERELESRIVAFSLDDPSAERLRQWCREITSDELRNQRGARENASGAMRSTSFNLIFSRHRAGRMDG